MADERCTVATLAAEQSEAAASALREAQRAYDDASSREEAAVHAADARLLRQAKDEAQQDFRRARDAARTRVDLERAATKWLTRIDRINRDAREAVAVAERERQRTGDLVGRMEELALAADAARISAEVAGQACQEARERLAACEEARTGAYAAEAISVPAAPDWDTLTDEEPVRAISPVEPDGRQPAIVLLLRGDRETLGRVVTALGGESADDRRRYQLLLSDLVDAIVARAIEENVLDFPEQHRFWGGFTRRQCRDIATALASLGYRFDGLGGFSSGRPPSQRDLSLAVGYAGLDPMRIRRWPTEADMGKLFQQVTVAADEYLATTAGDLSLGEMVSLLGRRAEGLSELWNNWGRVRPLLLAATG
jgi:hypothetical protein